MIKELMEGLLLGISTGTVCLVTCSPIYLPWLMSEDRSLKNSLYKIFEISGGRFVSYILFGALAGYLGSNIQPMNRELFTGISYILLTVFLLINVFRTQKHSRKCLVPKWSKFSNSAFLLGILTGINFCPSFLIALSKSVQLGGVISGINVFIGFFVGTTLFLLPLAFSGLLTEMKYFKITARVATVIVAAWFMYEGIQSLYHIYHQHRADQNKRFLELSDNTLAPIMVFDSAHKKDFSVLSDSLTAFYGEKTEILPVSQKPYQIQTSEKHLYFLEEGIPIIGDTLSADIIRINRLTDVNGLMELLRNNTFKLSKGKGLRWSI